MNVSAPDLPHPIPITPIVQLMFDMGCTGNGSDVFGSDICTCKPYLVFAIEECIRTAQRGGVGVVVYFRKEGRALGEVTKSVNLASPVPSFLNGWGILVRVIGTWCTT